MADEAVETSHEISDDDLYEGLRQELHSKIDAAFAGAETGPDIYWQLFAVAGHLFKHATSAIDLWVAYEMRSGAVDAEASMAGERARNAVSEMLLGIGGRTAQSTAADGLIGAHMTVQQLAVFSQDPYLTVLATALEQLRVGQVHPWLVPPKVPVHPKRHASQVLGLRAIPFGVIEYLFGSGHYTTKTDANAAVVTRLGISENTLNDWGKQQRRYRRAQFDLNLRTIALVAAEVKKARERVKTMPEFEHFIEVHDARHGLRALDAVRDRLKELGAHRGQPTGFQEGGG